MVRFTTVALLTLIVTFAIGCSSQSKNPITPLEKGQDIPAVSDDKDMSGQVFWGMWDLNIDLEKNTVETVPSRNIDAHINITSLIPSPQITILGYDPMTKIVNVLVTINNPYSIEGYDVRGILMTNDQGLLLTNDDGWTDLYDTIGGRGQNPFKAYAKHLTNRKFPAHTQQSEQFLIYYPNPPGAIKLVVEASYPGNCLEPYQIQGFTQTALYDSASSSAEISVQVSDWQNDVSAVRINAYQITGVYYTNFAYQAATSKWTATIINTNGKPAGQYECLLLTESTNSGYQALYDYVNITITQTPCPSDNNNSCGYAQRIYLDDTVSGCIDQYDNNDWYAIYSSPGGIQSGTVSISYNGATPYLYVYSADPGTACPGTMVGSGQSINLTSSTMSLYYILVTGATGRCEYNVTAHLTPAIANVQCEFFVARNSSNQWPIWEAPSPDIELTITHLQNQLSWTNSLWNRYGYNFVWDGTVTFMASQYYVLNNSTEAWQMHATYGASTNKVCFYFVDYLDSGLQTAYATPITPKSQHTVSNTFTAYSPNVWYWQQAISHEQGHIIGYYFDQYLFDYYGVSCGDEGALPSGLPTYLYSDPLGCYAGNLMWYYYDGWAWNRFDLTYGQRDYQNNFHYALPSNFPWY